MARGDERSDAPTVRLASGMVATIRPDPFEAGSRILVVDMLQSDITIDMITGLVVLHGEK